MIFYHLWLLIQKSLRYAHRQRICKCCPRVLCEFLVPAFCLFLLLCLRWIHTSSSNTRSSPIHIDSSKIQPNIESIQIFNYSLTAQCPTSTIPIEISNRNLYEHFKRSCGKNTIIYSENLSRLNGRFYLNSSSIQYQCQMDESSWCKNFSSTDLNDDLLRLQHPSSNLCSNQNREQSSQFMQIFLNIQSIMKSFRTKQQLIVYTWPCLSYLTDPLFDNFPKFSLVMFLIFVDGCILFNFNRLFDSLIDEKRQGITELLRLISIQPILNSLAWFLRYSLIQILINIFLIFILKKSFDGETYLPYVSFAFLIPTIFLWTIQVFSRSVLVAHCFHRNLKASIWSWFIYIISFYLALSSTIRLPTFLHTLATAWFPFYSIKRTFILFFRMNHDLSRSSYFSVQLVYIWLSMIIGSVLMWLLSFYLEQIFPGKYGIARPWSWPLDFVRNHRIKAGKRRESVAMQMVETLPDATTTVRVNSLTKTYGRFHAEKQLAVDHISFKLESSTIHGLIGHNGAGKTTTIEMLCGLLPCDCGSIEIHDKDLYENLSELRRYIGYCPQQDMLFSHLTVFEQLEFYARVRSNGNQTSSTEDIEHLLDLMDMKTYRQRLCHTLSGGMQRKLSILCAFVGQANVILLDEPSSSLDPVARRQLWSWLRENKTNRTLLISSHLLDEVEELCDTILILDNGKIRAQGTILDLKRQFGPAGDRLHLERIPSYIPTDWILNSQTHHIQIPTRQQLITVLKKLEHDQIKYSLENITLDDIFLKLTSSTDEPTENTIQSKIEKLFETRTSSKRTHLYTQQTIGVLIRRGQVFLRRARLLPIILLLYLAYALSPLYMPTFAISSTDQVRYIVTAPVAIQNRLSLPKTTDRFYSIENFQKYLLNTRTWYSDYYSYKTIIGIRIPSLNKLECFVPSPVLPNMNRYCLKIFSQLTNTSVNSLEFVNKNEKQIIEQYSSRDFIFFCLYSLPPRFHFSIILLSIILIVAAALAIQDHASSFHSYSIIHGLRPIIHWLITYLSDLILCFIWLIILIIIDRLTNPQGFHGTFFALTPLYFLGNLPLIYLLAKCFRSPIIGATMILFILQFVHLIFTFRLFFEGFRTYLRFPQVIPILRWSLILIFPNINIYILIISILQSSSCPVNNLFDQSTETFVYENYSSKTLIHVLIFLVQILIYFLVLILIDTWKLIHITRAIKGTINLKEEDADVQRERQRIETMTEQDKQAERLVVDNLSKRYGWTGQPAVNRLTFAVPHRQCFGLLGFNGSGKTTTFRMLVRELRPTGGHIYTANKESIGYCPQDDISFSALTVLQSIDYICRLHGIQPLLINDLIITQFQLEKYRHRLVSRLSGGTVRRLHLALCLIGSPTLLLLDEPTAKVDPLLRAHIRLILQHRPIDTSIVFASHSMLECEQLCDRLTILVHGNARCLGSPAHLKEQYGTEYRIRLTPIGQSINVPRLTRVDNTNEYNYPKSSLANLFEILEDLVERNIIAPNYTVQLTSLEHIFLTFQHAIDEKF